ncbi:hypothetical protein HID58_064902 [Brassica napus]|uniref:thioglucosidase n=1 Tax=Brassica napus TaxID=3708 RepID=A0ABQ7ZBP8_BRANA|nr:hypothetical protein HID58_064902 [Brassica napus]
MCVYYNGDISLLHIDSINNSVPLIVLIRLPRNTLVRLYKRSKMKIPLLGLLLLPSLVGSPTRAEEGPVCPKTETLSRASFPEGFMFGTATASYQVEGAVNEGCRGPNLWDLYTKKFPHRVKNHNADEAVDFYHRYKEDIKLMKKLNTDAFRLSIAWPRIFPHGRMEKGISKEGVQFYHDLIDKLLKNDITPLVTAFHWDIPADLEDEYGGFLSERTGFCGVRKLHVPRIWGQSEKLDYVQRAMGLQPFRLRKHRGVVLRTSKILDIFAKMDGQDLRLMSLVTIYSLVTLKPLTLSESAKSAKVVKLGLLIVRLGLNQKMWKEVNVLMKDAVGARLPKFTKSQKAKLKGSADFVGINYNSSFYAKASEKPDYRQPSWATDSLPRLFDGSVKIGSQPSTAKMAVYAAGLRKLVKYIKDRYGNPEIIITENGYGEDLGVKDTDHSKILSPEASSGPASGYLVNVTSYFVWSLMDNFEWQDGYTARFGLYYIDFKNSLTRMEKESAKWFTEFLKPGPKQKSSKSTFSEEL